MKLSSRRSVFQPQVAMSSPPTPAPHPIRTILILKLRHTVSLREGLLIITKVHDPVLLRATPPTRGAIPLQQPPEGDMRLPAFMPIAITK
jgi:hypothetical protein